MVAAEDGRRQQGVAFEQARFGGRIPTGRQAVAVHDQQVTWFESRFAGTQAGTDMTGDALPGRQMIPLPTVPVADGDITETNMDQPVAVGIDLDQGDCPAPGRPQSFVDLLEPADDRFTPCLQKGGDGRFRCFDGMDAVAETVAEKAAEPSVRLVDGPGVTTARQGELG